MANVWTGKFCFLFFLKYRLNILQNLFWFDKVGVPLCIITGCRSASCTGGSFARYLLCRQHNNLLHNARELQSLSKLICQGLGGQVLCCSLPGDSQSFIFRSSMDEWSLQKTHAHLCGYVSKTSYGPKIGMLDQSIPIVLRKTEDIKGKRRILCSGWQGLRWPHFSGLFAPLSLLPARVIWDVEKYRRRGFPPEKNRDET